jgi:ABC-type Fe3+/spermidine/putrescine transport system ATPase subunit
VLDGGAASTANGNPRVEGVVESSLYLGTSTQIVVDLGAGVRMTVLVPNADEAQRQRLPGGGARVALSWQPEHMHVVREGAKRPRGESYAYA